MNTKELLIELDKNHDNPLTASQKVLIKKFMSGKAEPIYEQIKRQIKLVSELKSLLQMNQSKLDELKKEVKTCYEEQSKNDL